MYFQNNNIGKMLVKNPEMFWYFVVAAGIRTAYAKIYKRTRKLRTKHYAGKIVNTQDRGNEILTEMLESGKPFMFGRCGSNELIMAGSGLLVESGIKREIYNPIWI